jgi:hypothetical protein
MLDHITRYDTMPIPGIDSLTEFFAAGAITVGVEFRCLTDAAIAANSDRVLPAAGTVARIFDVYDDSGVSLHVYGDAEGERLEYLRFDCFIDDPHYHYVSWTDRVNDVLHMDPVADGDPLAWALERIRTRLPQMLERAGTPKNAAAVNLQAIERIMPQVAEAAYRARFHADQAAIKEAAEHPPVAKRA